MKVLIVWPLVYMQTALDVKQSLHMQALDGAKIQGTAKQYQERCKTACELYPDTYALWAEQNLPEDEWAAAQQLALRWVKGSALTWERVGNRGAARRP